MDDWEDFTFTEKRKPGDTDYYTGANTLEEQNTNVYSFYSANNMFFIPKQLSGRGKIKSFATNNYIEKGTFFAANGS